MCGRCAIWAAFLAAARAFPLACVKPADRAGAAALIAHHNFTDALAPCLLDCEGCDHGIDPIPDDAPPGLYHDKNHRYRVRRQYPGLEARLARVANGSGVLFWGDSLYAMFDGACDGRGVCANGGVGEDTWLSSLQRLWMACAAKPRLVFVLLGVNDVQHRRPARRTVDIAAFALKYMKRCTGATVVLQSLLPAHKVHTEHLNARQRSLAGRLEIPFCDVRGQMQWGAHWGGYLREDGLHLTDAGNAALRAALDETCVDRLARGEPLAAAAPRTRAAPRPQPPANVTRVRRRKRKRPGGLAAWTLVKTAFAM